MLLVVPGEAADMGPSGIPEEYHAAFYQHVGHPDQVPFPAVAGIEGILDRAVLFVGWSSASSWA